jgi:hypothetical protein
MPAIGAPPPGAGSHDGAAASPASDDHSGSKVVAVAGVACAHAPGTDNCPTGAAVPAPARDEALLDVHEHTELMVGHRKHDPAGTGHYSGVPSGNGGSGVGAHIAILG